MSASDFDEAVETYREALGRFVQGDPAPVLSTFSQRDNVTLANPLGPPHRGWSAVVQASEHAAAGISGGSIRFEEVSRYSTGEMGYVLELHRVEAHVAGSPDKSPISLRVTTVFRREGDAWRVAHRHADPITTPRDLSTIVEQSP